VTKEFGGQPLWVWLVGAVAVIGGYLYFRSHSTSSSSAAGGQGGGGQGRAASPGFSNASFTEWITQHQGGGGDHDKGPQPKIGPEREWLIHKTGSQHPWTFLARHHERIEVGPHGSRKIVHG
jgi:hypothetical protein